GVELLLEDADLGALVAQAQGRVAARRRAATRRAAASAGRPGGRVQRLPALFPGHAVVAQPVVALEPLEGALGERSEEAVARQRRGRAEPIQLALELADGVAGGAAPQQRMRRQGP